MSLSSKKSKILGIALVAVLFACVGLNVSKYVTSESVNSSKAIAKWAVSLSGNGVSRNSYNAATITADKIAPGTQGTFDVTVNATGSEVGVKYDVVISNAQNIPTNLYFQIGGTGTKYSKDQLSALATALSGTINANDSTKSVTKSVTWKWDYETGSTDSEKATNNAIDTNEGTAAKTMSFEVTVNAYQVQPAA